MQGIYTYIPETNCVPRKYSVVAILLLLFMVLVSLVSVLNLLYFYISTFRSMRAVPNMAVFWRSLLLLLLLLLLLGRDSAVGIATRHGLDGPGIESRWGKIFRTRPDPFWDPPSFLYNGYRVFPSGKAIIRCRTFCLPGCYPKI